MQKIIGAKNWQKDTVSAVKNSGAKKQVNSNPYVYGQTNLRYKKR